MPTEKARTIFDTTLRRPVLTSRAALPSMPVLGSGIIVTPSAHRIAIRSRNARADPLHVASATMEAWGLEIEPRDDASSSFRCSGEANPPTLVNLAATLAMPLFASDIPRKIAAGTLLSSPGQGAST